MKEETEEVFSSDYMGLYSDGTIGISDGCGYVGSLEPEETRELYEALRKLFKETEKE